MNKSPLLKRFRRHKLPALVLLFSLIGTLVAWSSATHFDQANAQARFNNLAETYRQSLVQRMATYERVMLDLQGFFQVGGMSRHQFDVFARHIHIDNELPGIHSLGYIPVVRAADRKAFAAQMRHDGLPGYRMAATARQPFVYPIEYVYPKRRQVMGLEMSRDSERREGLDKARDTGQPAATRKTWLQSDARQAPAFLIFVPVYRSGSPHATVLQRRRALRGNIFAAFLASDLLRGTLGRDYQKMTDLAVFDGDSQSPAALLYASTPRAANADIAPSTGKIVHTSLDVAGRAWTLSFLAKPANLANDGADLPAAVLLAGCLISLLLASIAALYHSKRRLRWAKDEQNQRFRSLFEQHPDAVYAFDLQGRFVDANPATLKMTGLPLEELRKRTFRDVIDPALLDRSVARVASATNGYASYGETAIFGPQGERIELSTTNLPIVVDGQIVGLFGIARDITKRKRAEAALAVTRERLDSILASMEDIVWSDSLDHRQMMFLNQAVETIYGRSVEDFYVNPGLRREVVHPEDRVMTDTFVPRLVKEGRMSMSYRIIRPDGSVRWVKSRARVIHGTDGQAIRLDGIITDITEQVQAEREADKQKQLLAAMIDTLPIAIFMWDSQSCLLMVNAYAANMVGKSKEDIVGKTLWDIFPMEIAQNLKRGDDRVLESGLAIAFEEKTIRHGKECYVLAGKTALDLGEGPPLLLGYSIDITPRRQAEEALRRAHDELEDKVRERTEALQQANFALRELSAHLHAVREEERTRLAREIHDELGGTLAAIKFELSFAKTDADSKTAGSSRDLAMAIELVDTAVQSLRRIISDLRPSLLDEVGLWAALEWLTDEWQARVGIPCDFELLGEEIEVEADCATALFRIVQEALTNIMKHAQASKVHVLAETDETEINIRIQDNGQGASPDQIAHWMAFGIAGMHERARACGGQLSIESRAGKGMTIWVRVPRHSA